MKKMKNTVLVLLIGVADFQASERVGTLRLDPAPNMTRAELNYVNAVQSPRAALVLCPGSNGNGKSLIQDPEWQDFAKERRLALVGLSFASPKETLLDGTGYYYAANGSGEKLLEGIKLLYRKDLPLLLYGTSGGAHFTSRFEQWMPNRVLAWCAYSAGWWDKPRSTHNPPPGIVACGRKDWNRYGASLLYFQAGRSLGNPWLWVSLPDKDHEHSQALDVFVREYFTMILERGAREQILVDIDFEEIATDTPLPLTAILPSRSLLEDWKTIHEQ